MSKSLILLAILLCTSSLFGQSRSALEKERNRIIEELEIAEQQLKLAEKSTSTETSELDALNQKIKSREGLIDNLKLQLSLNSRSLSTNKDSIAKMDSTLARLQLDYASITRLNYVKTMAGSRWLALFSANTINEGILLWRYADQFQQYIEAKKTEIMHLRESMDTKNRSILEEKAYTDELLERENENFQLLADLVRQKAELVKELKSKEDEIKTERDNKRKDREKLNKKIESIILAELKKRNSKPKVTASDASFSNLRWPVESGYISANFGNQAHPTIKNLKINNNGIDITSKANSAVYAVGTGKVVGVTSIPGHDTMIIIEHGSNYTVYSKLATAKVTKDKEIAEGEVIGYLGSSAVLHFEIWNGKTKINPAKRLKNR